MGRNLCVRVTIRNVLSVSDSLTESVYQTVCHHQQTISLQAVKMASYSAEKGNESDVRLLPYSDIGEVKVQYQNHNEHDGTAGFGEVKLEKAEEEAESYERQQWGSKREYILSILGFCVGVGNLWRFPYMCNRNGGGAFLIPFVLSLVLCGMPLFFLEAAIGQFTGRGALHNWAFCPLSKGIGVSMCLVSLLSFWYYNTILAWSLYYLAMSCQATLPWSLCGQWWNTPSCTDFSTAVGNSSHGNASVLATNASSGAILNSTSAQNMTGAGEVTPRKLVSAPEEFWQHNVLQVSSGFDQPGHVVWYMAVALAVAVIFMFLGLVKGIRSSGKVVYVTAVAPYVLLTVLLVRGVTLPGAVDGIIFYLKPDLSRLLDPQVWVEAALQVFFSLGPAWGGLPTLASYNKFDNNCLRDSIILTFVCEGTSIFGGFAIFSVLGFMAREAGVPINKVVSSGPGLAFIVYPEAISRLPLPHLWAVLFFLMVFTLAYDSQLAMGECVLTALCDHFPKSINRYRMLVTAIFCAFCFLLALPFVTQGGVYVFQLVDWFIAAITLIFIGFIECVVIAWVYGADRFGADIQLMIGRKPPLFIRILWCFVTPLLLLGLIVVTLLKYKSPTYGDYHYDVWGNVFGWILALVSFVPMPLVAVHQLYKARGSLIQRLKVTTRPDKSWGPGGVRERNLYHKEAEQRPPRRHWTDIIWR